MNAGHIPTMPDGLPQPQPLGDDIDPLLRMMRENQKLAAELKEAKEKLAAQEDMYRGLREHCGRQLEAFGERVTLSEQRARRVSGQATLLGRSLARLRAVCTVDPLKCLTDEWQEEKAAATREACELLALLPPEMK